MCLIVIAWRCHTAHDLVFAANRDEFRARATLAAGFWPDAPQVFAGRDQRADGTWCGVGAGGRFAAVTNVREPDPPVAGQRSRGALVADYLRGDRTARDYCDAIYSQRMRYGGFNLLVGDGADLCYLGNRDTRGVLVLAPGVHALSNGVLGDVWPKTRRAEAGMQRAIADKKIVPATLLSLLADETHAAEAALPDTGVGVGLERFLSPIFIRGAEYGTRASTVMLRSSGGQLRFVEQSFGAGGAMAGLVDQCWQLA